MTITSLFQIIIGFVGLVCIAIPFSQNRSSINYRHIFAAIILQIVLAFALLKIPFIVQIFAYLSEGVTALQAATQEGAEFVFGYLSNSSTSPFENSGTGNSMIFAFQILPLIIVISSLSALLWFWNILPLIIRAISKIFEKLFNIGGPIGLGATANIIMGQVEAPLLVRPYLSRMSEKELLILMTAGMSTVSGSIMIALVSMLAPQFPDINLIQHLVSASILSIPAAIMYANIMIPSSEVTNFDGNSVPKVYDSSMDAITRGTRDGLDICLNVGAILIAFIALVSLLNSLLGILGGWIGVNDLSLQLILGYIFFPIVWLMGVPLSETLASAELLGLKTALNEFVAYGALANIEPDALSDRSKLITLYALCGFANFSSVGILVSGISAMAPERKNDLIKVSIKALIGATLASCMTGLVIGIF
ncbi:Na+-dependent nucleoside transporter [Gammaproteobacteria bacterium]|jgi:CNT family concentrative nucleoside transporter|nr:Na+-dependent nucleoside transporter [Gammaproteobacteria bacterium]MDB0009732.1 Na+-dependent nucleoside transporter [Gammaproteobacteria bacterium]MDB2339333.1 Na+-dependent nucleoside transporter [Gammaproteobacteria bacterium]MDC0387638.1 Na+-dependent nucleoside transporter [Gammaproteobacteria bacterium]MDC0906450.1 nucleoside transporter C-terminal domain-containing protein [Gammaproteobacteria bacterium]